MELVLNQEGMEPFESAKDLKIFVACEDPDLAGQACAFLDKLRRTNKAKGRLIYSWWNFEVLTLTAFQDQAVSEAVAADMIVFVARERSKLPKAVADWISLWLTTGACRRRALVAVLVSDPASKGASRRLISKLRQIAAMGRMDFLARRA